MSSPPITPSIQLVQTTPAPTPTLQLKRVVIPQVRFIYIDGKSYIVTVDSYIDNEPAWEKVLSATDKVMQVATLSAQAYNSDKTALNPERFKDLTEDPDVDNIKITFSCQDPNAELNFEALAYDRKSPKKGASVSKELKTETESLKTILGAPLESSTSSSTLKTSCNKLCPKDSATAAEALTPEEFSNTLSVLAKNRLTSYDTKNDLRTLENDISTATSPSLFVYNLQSNPILVFVHPKNKECFIIDPSGQHRHELITPLKLLKKKDPKTTFFFFSPQKASRQVKDSIKQQQLLLLFLHEVLHIQDNSFTAAQAKKTSYKLFKALSDPSSFVKHFSAWQTSLLKKYENFETRSQKLGVNLYPHALKKTIKDVSHHAPRTTITPSTATSTSSPPSTEQPITLTLSPAGAAVTPVAATPAEPSKDKKEPALLNQVPKAPQPLEQAVNPTAVNPQLRTYLDKLQPNAGHSDKKDLTHLSS